MFIRFRFSHAWFRYPQMRVRMSIPKDQFQEYWQETQPSNQKIINIFVRTKEGKDVDFNELIIEVEITPSVIRK